MSTNVKIDCLIKLQDVLQEKFILEDQKQQIPADLKADEALLNESSAKEAELSTLCQNLEDEFQKLCVKYDEACNQRIELEKQIEFLATAREFDTVTKVLEEAMLSEQTLLKLRNSKGKELETVKADLEAQTASVNELKEKVEKEMGKYQAAVDQINLQIAELDKKLDEIKKGKITDEVYEKFANIVRKKEGRGIVPVWGEVCQGCDLILPQQFVIDLKVKTMKDEIDYCPYCSRIIYKPEIDEAKEKQYTFEQIESASSSSRKGASAEVSEDSGFDESMEMGDDFDEF